MLSAESDGSAAVTTVPVASIDAGGHQPRKHFSESSLEELARSIKSKGVLQPILVEPAGGDRYTVVAGERRFRAARLAGLTEIPVLIRSFSELERTEIALIENLQREDLSPVEEAQGYKTLIELGSLTQEQVAQRIGKNRATVANSLRLLKLPDPMLEALDRRRISAGHARALLSVADRSAQQRIFATILEQELSVREAERLAAQAPRQQAPAPKRSEPLSAELQAVEQSLIERLGTKVGIRGHENRGRIEIYYYSMQDLERILGLVSGEADS